MKTWVKEVIFIVVVASILIGCMALNGAMVRIYPNKPLQSFIDIRVWNGYEINTACPYETIATDTGYDLIIHMVKNNGRMYLF